MIVITSIYIVFDVNDHRITPKGQIVMPLLKKEAAAGKMQELLVLMLNLKDLVYERLIGSENQRKKMLAAIKESKGC